jgi:hypothetical protein
MFKFSFYTFVLEKGKRQAKHISNGYSDGTFYYYKSDLGTWYAIHPLCGMAVTRATTRAAAAEEAHSAKTMEGLKRAHETGYLDRLTDQFYKAILELQKSEKEAANND